MIRCRFEDGGSADLRHVTVSSVILSKDHSQILLGKRAPHLPNGDKWCLPGGYLGRDETTTEAACREVLEETGYEVKIVSLLRLIDTPSRPKEDKQNVEFAYVVEEISKKTKPDTETAEIKWFPLDRVPTSADWAYDHYDTFCYCRDWLRKKFRLPVFNTTLL